MSDFGDVDVNSFSETQLLAALEEGLRNAKKDASGGANEPNTITTTEVKEKLQIGRTRANRLLRQLINDGKLERDYIYRVDAWGTRKRVQGFRYLLPTE